jgi:hypothetical protein
MATGGGTETLRCAVHPGLPAYDACPVCERPRCAADAAAAPGGGCRACEGRAGRTAPPPVDLATLVRAGVCCGLVAPLAGLVASEYVGAGIVGWVVPAFVGIVVAMVAEAAARKRRGQVLRWLAVAYSVVAIAVGLADPRAAGSPFTPVGRVLGQYVVAAAAAWYWTAPPRPKKRPAG